MPGTAKRVAMLALMALGVTGVGVGVAGDTWPETPSFTDDQITTYRALADSGYALLQAEAYERAIEVMSARVAALPSAPGGSYDLACAYARAGRTDEALASLTRAVEAGYDHGAHMASDPDLASLRDHPEFDVLQERAVDNARGFYRALAEGIPEVAPPSGITTEDSLEAWTQAEMNRVYRHFPVWTSWQRDAAQLEVFAMRVEAERVLQADDPEYEYELERVRAIHMLANQPRGPWWELADGVQSEADRYLASATTPEGVSEASFYAGEAAFLRESPESVDDPCWRSGVEGAEQRFAEVAPDSKFAPAVAAWRVNFALVEGDTGDLDVDFVHDMWETWRADFEFQSRIYADRTIAALWPIPFQTTDLDGKPVTLDQYAGKVLLIDFWATWCGPCVAEIPNLQMAHERFHDQGLEILSISLDDENHTSMDKFRSWIEERGMDWRHVCSGKGGLAPETSDFLVWSIPQGFLIGRDGSLLVSGSALRGEELVERVGEAVTSP